MEKNISNCCWEYFPPRGSKKLIEVGEKLQSLVIQPQISASASGENNRGPWGEKYQRKPHFERINTLLINLKVDVKKLIFND